MTLVSDAALYGPTGVLDILGSGLSFTNGGYLTPQIFWGTLSGTLLDGTPIDTQVLIASNPAPSIVATPTEIRFSTAAVPEPGSIALLGSGLGDVLALAARRRR